MSIIDNMLTDLRDEIDRTVVAFQHRQDDTDVVKRSADLNQVFLDAQGDVARLRREAVRRLRRSYSLREIAEMTGLAHQRISQIERGMDRKEKG